MRIGTLGTVRRHPDGAQTIVDAYADHIGDAVLAESLGFEFAWFGEHHFMECEWTPAPLLVCAAIAARTTRLRIGTDVTCAPFHHPLRLAEDLAVLDSLSGGRVDFGLGVGSRAEEYRAFAVDVNERHGRTWEAADLIWRCLTADAPFSHDGRFFRFPDIDFTTRPVQSPLPFWVGAHGPQNIRRTARRGWHLCSDNAQLFDAELTLAGRHVEDAHVAAMRLVCVAGSADEAWEAYGPGLHYFVNADNVPVGEPDTEVTIDMLRDGVLDGTPYAPVIGDADTVRSHFEELASGARGRVTHSQILFRQPGMTNADVHRSMELFAAEVLPAVRP